MTVIARDSNNNTLPAIRPGVVQKLTTSAASNLSAALGTNTTIVRIVATAAVHYVLGGADAAVTDTYLPANVVEYLSVRPGEKIAFIQDAAGGVAYVTEGA